MSQHLINEYRAELDRLRAASGSRRESVLREAFKDLLKRWGKSHDLQFIAEHDIVTRAMNRIYLDGALLHGLRVPFGYWEAKGYRSQKFRFRSVQNGAERLRNISKLEYPGGERRVPQYE